MQSYGERVPGSLGSSSLWHQESLPLLLPGVLKPLQVFDMLPKIEYVEEGWRATGFVAENLDRTLQEAHPLPRLGYDAMVIIVYH